ncbi:hypothetical protein NDA16_004920 [Ustilago loliicola]|nr:hypothetical protein NDA16_004920 [Ustilago loliicola]
MAFVHHQPRQHRRDRQDHTTDSPSASYATPHYHRQEREVTQDWSIVFPGRARQAPASPTLELASPATPSTDHTDDDDTDPLALTLPPLHDGTGRFLASPLGSTSTDVASIDAAHQYSGADDDRLSEEARHSEDVFPESVFSGTDSQLDADEELGFGSGSDFDFESDAVASSHPSRSSARRGAARTASRRRPSKLSHVSVGSDDDEAHPSHSHSHLLGSKAWSLLGRSNALERVLESPSGSIQLYSSARSSRHIRRSRRSANHLPVVFTSGSEREDRNDDQGLEQSRPTARRVAQATYDADLAASNLAQSAGLSHLDHNDLLRRPKRRHRRSAAGRSSKRSNISQSLLSIDYESRLLNARAAAPHARRHTDGVETPRSSITQASRMAQEHPSKTTRMIGTILRKLFDLEPEVLDAFLHKEHHSSSASQQQRQAPGFAFESGETPLASAPLGHSMMLDGRSEHERYSPTSASDTEVEHQLDPSTSPLFSNLKPVSGEETDSASPLRLTEAALLQRGRSSSTPPSLMEPTTMEALSAFMNTMVMPVPMPFRILGALFGWGSIWTPSSNLSQTGKEREEDEAAAERDAEEERKYRYERLLSAQQAKAWSRRYRGILFANVDDEEPSPDVPELWRGEEHPAIAQHVGDYD